MRNSSRTVLIWSGHLFVPLACCISTDIFFLCSCLGTRRDVPLLLGVRVVNRSFRRLWVERCLLKVGFLPCFSLLFFLLIRRLFSTDFFKFIFVLRRLVAVAFQGLSFFPSELNCWWRCTFSLRLASAVAGWAVYTDDELMLNVLRCHLTY